MGDLHGCATFYRYGWVNRRNSSVNRHVCLGIPKGLSSHCFIESMMCIPVSIRDTPISIDAYIYRIIMNYIDYIILIHVMCISVCDIPTCILCRLLAGHWHIQVGVGWQLPSPSKILGWPPWVSYGERQGLVVWNMIFVFPYIYIGNFFIPTDDSYFSEGRLKHQPDYIKCKDDGVGTLGWSISFSVWIHWSTSQLNS